MGAKRPRVIVQGPSPEELKQREAQFSQQMSVLQQLMQEQQASLLQQLQQQQAAAKAQEEELANQLVSLGNVNATNALQSIIQLVQQQSSVGQESYLEREKQEALSTQQARIKTRANVAQRQTAQSFSDVLTQLSQRRKT